MSLRVAMVPARRKSSAPEAEAVGRRSSNGAVRPAKPAPARHVGLGLPDSVYPETEALSAQVCSLPMCVELEDEEVDYVIDTVKGFYDA